MVYYDTNSSSFYKANETYCLQIEQLFQTLQVACDGYCNSWGFELNATYIKNNITTEFRFYKETIRQTSVLPVESQIIEWLDVTMSPLNRNNKICFKESKIKRFFMSKELKGLIESPYYFSSNINIQSSEMNDWLSLIKRYDIDLLKLNKGDFTITINHRVEEPLKLISELEPMIKFYI